MARRRSKISPLPHQRVRGSSFDRVDVILVREVAILSSKK